MCNWPSERFNLQHCGEADWYAIAWAAMISLQTYMRVRTDLGKLFHIFQAMVNTPISHYYPMPFLSHLAWSDSVSFGDLQGLVSDPQIRSLCRSHAVGLRRRRYSATEAEDLHICHLPFAIRKCFVLLITFFNQVEVLPHGSEDRVYLTDRTLRVFEFQVRLSYNFIATWKMI